MHEDNLAMAYESIQSYKMTAGGWERGWGGWYAGSFTFGKLGRRKKKVEKKNQQMLWCSLFDCLKAKGGRIVEICEVPPLSVFLLCCGGLDGIDSQCAATQLGANLDECQLLKRSFK